MISSRTYFKDVDRFYCSLLRWLSNFAIRFYMYEDRSWRATFQFFYGNVFDIIPLDEINEIRFPQHFHPFHILPVSPWPFCLSFSLLTLVSGILDFLTSEVFFGFFLFLGVFCVCFCLWCWWSDVIEESLTAHTKRIKYGIALGMVLFIVSEVMFFFSFFWSFFHVSLSPSIELGCVWPPKGLESLVIAPFGAPLLNTLILISSGVTLTCAHYAFLIYCYRMRLFANYFTVFSLVGILKSMFVRINLKKKIFQKAKKVGGFFFFYTREWWWFTGDLYIKKQLKTRKINILRVFKILSLYHFFLIKRNIFTNILLKVTFSTQNPKMVCVYSYFLVTLILAVFFTISQIFEYISANVCISDGVYGSTFYMMTGFHGFHVVVGTIFLFVCFVRILFKTYSYVHFIGLECAIWYWHFVDVVWLFLYLFVYIWGNGLIPVVDLSMFPVDFSIAADFASNYQCDFQDSASFLMEAIVDLHNYIMFYLWVILGFVVWMLGILFGSNIALKLRRNVLYIKMFFWDMYARDLIARNVL